jgi:hypothetical protein
MRTISGKVQFQRIRIRIFTLARPMLLYPRDYFMAPGLLGGDWVGSGRRGRMVIRHGRGGSALLSVTFSIEQR